MRSRRRQGIDGSVPAVFPDIHFAPQDALADGHKVNVRWTCHKRTKMTSGTFPPTGKPVTFTGITIYPVVDEKIAERRFQEDGVGLQQPKARS